MATAGPRGCSRRGTVSPKRAFPKASTPITVCTSLGWPSGIPGCGTGAGCCWRWKYGPHGSTGKCRTTTGYARERVLLYVSMLDSNAADLPAC